jgi:hypothetical protein
MYDPAMTKTTGPERLATEILKQAARDFKRGPHQEDAKIFFNGKWFGTLCDLLDIDPAVIRQKLMRRT